MKLMNQLNKFNDINNYIYDNALNGTSIKDENLKVESTRIVTKIALKNVDDKVTLERIANYAGLEDKKSEKLLMEKANSLNLENQNTNALTR